MYVSLGSMHALTNTEPCPSPSFQESMKKSKMQAMHIMLDPMVNDRSFKLACWLLDPVLASLETKYSLKVSRIINTFEKLSNIIQ